MISVTDIDANDAENFLVTLSVADGVLALVSRDGVVVNGRGTTAEPLTLTGRLTSIDAALAKGVVFYPRGGFHGTTTVTVNSFDRGNSGLGGELTDSDSFKITIVDPNPLDNEAGEPSSACGRFRPVANGSVLREQ